MKDYFRAHVRLERERERLEEDAIGFLRSGLFADRPEDCPRYLHLTVSADEKKLRPQDYEKGLACFKALFRSGEERHRLALWNMIVNYYHERSKFCKVDFSEEENAFLQRAMEGIKAQNSANVNAPMKTKRLLLRPIGQGDQICLADHFRQDGDFEAYTGLAPTKRNIDGFTFELRRSTYFAIERRSDRKLIGYVGLSLKEETSTGLLEYYLFPEERRRGYCKEAVEALARTTLAGKLYEPVETVQYGVYRKKAVRLNAIRARISSVNTASQRTVESCGFVREATIHQTSHRGVAGWTDEEIYYLTAELLKNTQK